MENQLPKGDIGKSFAKLVDDIYVKYKGCLINKELTGFSWAGKYFSTLEEAQAEIDGTKLLNIQPPPDYHRTHIEVTVVDKEGNESEIPDTHKEKYLTGNSAYNSYKNNQ